MLDKYRRLSSRMLIVLIGLGTGAVAVSAHQLAISDPVNKEIQLAQATEAAQPTYCEIQASTSNGQTTIKGVFYSDSEFNGTYRFKVASSQRSGNSNISQGGNFSARSGDIVTLGQVMLGGSGAIYSASLEITTGKAGIVCQKRIGNTA